MKKVLVLISLVFLFCLGACWSLYQIRSGQIRPISIFTASSPHQFYFPITLFESAEITIAEITPVALEEQALVQPGATLFIPPSPENAGPESLNGIPLDDFLVIPESTRLHILEIYQDGQRLGLNARVFSKVGDSLSEIPLFLAPFDEGRYLLAEYDNLQDTINFFAGSFGRDSRAVSNSMHAWTVFDAFWVFKPDCESGEAPIECEFRLNNPSLVLVRLGSNDVGLSGRYRENLQKIIDFSTEHGAIPVLVTKADRIEGSDANNEIVRDLGSDNQVPLWDYDRIAQTLPGNGLGEDSIHPTLYYTHDYSQAEALQSGQSVENLTALMMLDKIRRIISQLGY